MGPEVGDGRGHHHHIGVVGYQTTLLVERAGAVLTPELISELRGSVLT